jgi:carboxymethylenebutenolidase
VRVEEIDAAAPFYGIPPPGLADPAKAIRPVQAHFGDKDHQKGFSDPSAVDALEPKLKSATVETQLFRYPDVGHAFMVRNPCNCYDTRLY